MGGSQGGRDGERREREKGKKEGEGKEGGRREREGRKEVRKE